MVIRVMSYDGAAYRKIIKDRDKAKRKEQKTIPPLHPVITLVLYFGAERWTAPRNLKEALYNKNILEKYPKDQLENLLMVKPYVGDYPINVVELQYLADETVQKFRSDFRYVAELMTQLRKVREGKLERPTLTFQEIEHANELVDLLKTMSGDIRFEEMLPAEGEKGSGRMFELFDIMEQRGIEQGLKQGRLQEQENTRKETARADAAEKQNAILQERIRQLEAQLQSGIKG